jgi:hypothetical protein
MPTRRGGWHARSFGEYDGTMSLLLFLAAVARAADPVDDEPYTVVVTAERTEAQARRELAGRLEELGYHFVGVDKDGYELWENDGATRFRVGLKEGLVRVHIPKDRRSRAAAGRLFDALAGPLATWRDRIWHDAQRKRWAQVESQLRDVWERGRGPDGQPLPDVGSRKAEIVRLWLDTSHPGGGPFVRARIREYVADHVQAGPEPYSDAEIADADAARPFEDSFFAPIDAGEALPPPPVAKDHCFRGVGCVFPLRDR